MNNDLPITVFDDDDDNSLDTPPVSSDDAMLIICTVFREIFDFDLDTDLLIWLILFVLTSSVNKIRVPSNAVAALSVVLDDDDDEKDSTGVGIKSVTIVSTVAMTTIPWRAMI